LRNQSENLFIRLNRRILKPGESLSSRVVVSGFWVFVLRAVSQVLSLARTIVLARLLAPGDFGLIGITMVVMSILETFSQTGFQSALIQKKDDIEEYLDTAWTALALRGALLYALLFFAAPYAAAFYETPEAGPVIRAAGLVMLINGLMNIRVVYFKKELEFQKQFLFLLAGTLADLLISIAFALVLQSIWALVYGLLAGSLVKLVVSYVIAPQRPRVRLDFSRLKDLYSYGRWIFWTSVFIFFLTEGDDAFLGKVLGVTALGFYQMAHRISNLPATEITHVISQVTFPAYAKLQDHPEGLRDAYLRVLKLTALLSIPAAAGIFILAPELTQLLLGDKWMPMVPVMRVMVVGGAVRSIGATMGPVFQAVGKPEILSRFLLVQVLLVAALIYPLTITWGIVGTGLSVMIPGLIVNAIFAYQIMKITGVEPARFFKAVGYPLLGSVVMLLAVFLVKTYVLLPSTNVLAFALLVILGAAVYFSFAALMELHFDYRIRSVFRPIQV
jgi:O-antigen/teichoic acid export membrane protein